MKQAGKAHWLVILGVLSVLVLLGLVMFGKDTAADTAGEFMSSLAKGDVDKLTELSYLEGVSPEETRKQWDFAVNRAAPYYRFVWSITSVNESDEENAAAIMQVTRNADQGGFEERFQLPLVKVDGAWKVDVRAISRDLFPALPR